MVSRRRTICSCSRSLQLSPALIFLSAILPSTPFAQLTNPSNIATSLDGTPSTFETPPTPSSPNPTQNNAAATTTAGSDDDKGRKRNGTASFYFILLAALIVLFIVAMLYINNRKSQKAAAINSNSQRVLAQDLEGLRNRFGMRRGAMRRAHSGEAYAQCTLVRAEGLNERGEAPPPYGAGSKPPSLRSNDGAVVREVACLGTGDGQTVEMNTIEAPGQDPPGYDDFETNMNRGGNGHERWVDLDMARPAPVVMAPTRRDASIQ